MFLIINTSQQKHTGFQCESRFEFCKLTSEKYHLKDVSGRLVFDLSLINGDNNIVKIKEILKNIKVEWTHTNYPPYSLKAYYSDIVREQQEYLAKFVLSDLYSDLENLALQNYRVDQIIQLSFIQPFIQPYHELYEDPEFNELGFYKINY